MGKLTNNNNIIIQGTGHFQLPQNNELYQQELLFLHDSSIQQDCYNGPAIVNFPEFNKIKTLNSIHGDFHNA